MLGLFRLLALYIPFLLVLFLDTWLLLLHSVGIISIFDILLYQLRVDDFAQSGGTCCFHGANSFTSSVSMVWAAATLLRQREVATNGDFFFIFTSFSFVVCRTKCLPKKTANLYLCSRYKCLLPNEFCSRSRVRPLPSFIKL